MTRLRLWLYQKRFATPYIPHRLKPLGVRPGWPNAWIWLDNFLTKGWERTGPQRGYVLLPLHFLCGMFDKDPTDPRLDRYACNGYKLEVQGVSVLVGNSDNMVYFCRRGEEIIGGEPPRHRYNPVDVYRSIKLPMLYEKPICYVGKDSARDNVSTVVSIAQEAIFQWLTKHNRFSSENLRVYVGRELYSLFKLHAALLSGDRSMREISQIFGVDLEVDLTLGNDIIRIEEHQEGQVFTVFKLDLSSQFSNYIF